MNPSKINFGWQKVNPIFQYFYSEVTIIISFFTVINMYIFWRSQNNRQDVTIVICASFNKRK